VHIGTRRRGEPLDLMVAEAMILANSTWGQWLADCGVPGIYRSQASLAPGVKVRMGTKAQPHAGIGVRCYAWSTSPLRRYVDLVNQWQIIACARYGKTAALAAPFKPKDASLFSVVSAFDAAYSAYNGSRTAWSASGPCATCSRNRSASSPPPWCATTWCGPTCCRWCCR
jgi:exoribonuclease II